MKKISIIASSLLIFTLMGCGNNNTKTSDSTNSNNSTSTTIKDNSINSTSTTKNKSIESGAEKNKTKIPVLSESKNNGVYSNNNNYYSSVSNSSSTQTSAKTPTQTPATTSVKVAEVNIGNDKEVEISPVSSEVENDDYAYTSNDLGIVTKQKISKPTKLSGKFNNADNAIATIANVKKTPPYLLNAKTIPKPITSEDGDVISLFQFSPKNPFDVSVAVTNYKSLLAIPNSFQILQNKQIPLTDVSADIGFFDTTGRIWDINKKYEDKNISVNITILLSNKVVKDKNLTKGLYTLYSVENGKLFPQTINLGEKNGSLNGKVTLNKIAPFVLAKNESPQEKNISINSDFTKTNFVLPVFALKNDKIIGMGKIVDNSGYIYLTENNPTNYKLVSYILKNNSLKTAKTDLIITKDDLNSKFPIADLWSPDDSNIVQKITTLLNNDVDISADDINDLKNVSFGCDNNSLWQDYNKTVDNFITQNNKDMLEDKYFLKDNNCSVTHSVMDKLSIDVKCSNGLNTTTLITSDDNKTYSVNYTMNFVEDIDGEKYPEYIKATYNLIKNENDLIVDNFKINEVSVEGMLSVGSGYKEKEIKSDKYDGTLNYRNGKYLYKASNKLSHQFMYKYEDSKSGTQTETETLNFNTNSSQIFKKSGNFLFEDSSKYSALVNDIDYKFSGSESENKENVTLNNKSLVVTKDDSMAYHFNMSKEGFKSYSNTKKIEKPIIAKSISFGDVTIIPQNGKFTKNINLKNNATINLFKQISIKLDDDSLKNKEGSYDMNLTVTIFNSSKGDSLTTKLVGIKSLIDENGGITTTIDNGKLSIIDKGLDGWIDVEKTISNLKTNDLSFNLDTITNKANLDKLNKYLTKDGEYLVTVKFDTNLPLSDKYITGSIKVNVSSTLKNPPIVPSLNYAQ